MLATRTPTRQISYSREEYDYYQKLEKDLMRKTLKNASGVYKEGLKALYRQVITQPV
tara:strand:- start:332 stop:502 length:171 start_codon:yes stop_codon:yes gene_type:complete